MWHELARHTASCGATVASSHVDRAIDERALLRAPLCASRRGNSLLDARSAMRFERVPGAGVVQQRKHRAGVGVGAGAAHPMATSVGQTMPPPPSGRTVAVNVSPSP